VSFGPGAEPLALGCVSITAGWYKIRDVLDSGYRVPHWLRLSIGAVRDAAWLDADRAQSWARVMAVLVGVWAAILIAGQVLQAPWGGLGRDFTPFWAAGDMARAGHGALVYQPDMLMQAEQHAAPGTPYQPFLYPPPYLLFCRLIASLPYWPAFVLFMAAGFVPLLAGLRALAPGIGLLPLLAFPGLVYSLSCGQNGMISAACFAGFAVFADRRPYLAGACLGLLAYKPQLAAAAPLILLVAGRWRSFAAAGATYAAFCLASLIVLGADVWRAFFDFAGHAGTTFDLLAVSPVQQARIVSTFDAMVLLGAAPPVAWAAHIAVASTVMGALLWFAWRRPAGGALGAALAVGALLMTPYTLDYDLVCIAPALAWIVGDAMRVGWPAYGRVAVLCGYVLPLVATLIAVAVHVQVAPLILGIIFVTIGRKQFFLERKNQRTFAI
jgi:alpha-1,2-mannosyltransferase